MDKIVQIINEWDPLGFFPMAPSDEYNEEICQIYEYLNDNVKVRAEELAIAINEIFVSAFGSDIYKEDMSRCEEVAKMILAFW